MAKQLKDLGVNTPVLTGDGAQVPELVSIGGAAVEGLYFTALFHRQGATSELGRRFLQAYESTFKKQLDAFAALGGEAYYLLLAAIQRAGALNGAKIAQALAETKNFPGVTGVITMGPDHNPIKGVTVIKVEKGQFAVSDHHQSLRWWKCHENDRSTINPEQWRHSAAAGRSKNFPCSGRF